MKRVCILGASLDTGNMGVSALASGSVTAALHAAPGASLSFLDYGRDPGSQSVLVGDHRVPVKLVNLRFSKRFWLSNNIARLLLVASASRLLPEKWRVRWLQRYECLANVLRADLVGSLAGGDSFSDVYGLSRLIYVALPQLVVLQLGKQLILLPQTLGPFKGRIARLIARYIIGRAALVCARDRQSLSEATELMGGRAWKPRFSYDMAFVMSAAGVDPRLDALIPRRRERTPLIGLNVSGLLSIGGYSRKNMFNLKVDYMQFLERVVDYLVKEEGANVLLVPHVFGEAPENDVASCTALYNGMSSRMNGHVHVINESLDQHEVKYVIGQCDFFLGSRMHACIAALSQAVPAVSLAYSRKFAGVMEALGMGELVVDLREHDEASALRRVRELLAERKRIHDELSARIPDVKRCVFDVFREQRFQSDYSQTSQ